MLTWKTPDKGRTIKDLCTIPPASNALLNLLIFKTEICEILIEIMNGFTPSYKKVLRLHVCQIYYVDLYSTYSIKCPKCLYYDSKCFKSAQ